MIKMISGTTRINKQTIAPANGWFTAPSEVERRLVERGVAVYATEYGTGGVATLPGGVNDTGTGENPHQRETGAECDESAHLDPEQLKELTNDRLRELARDMGIDTAKLKTKAQLIEAITAEDVTPGDEDEDDAPPELAPEAPVV